MGTEDEPERWLVIADNGTQGYLIATIENGQPGDCLETEAATARLIAAAPDLLAALKELNTAEWLNLPGRAGDIIEQAIWKAEGRLE